MNRAQLCYRSSWWGRASSHRCLVTRRILERDFFRRAITSDAFKGEELFHKQRLRKASLSFAHTIEFLLGGRPHDHILQSNRLWLVWSQVCFLLQRLYCCILVDRDPLLGDFFPIRDHLLLSGRCGWNLLQRTSLSTADEHPVHYLDRSRRLLGAFVSITGGQRLFQVYSDIFHFLAHNFFE